MRKFLIFALIGITAMTGITAQTIIASGDCGAQGNNLTWVLNSDSVLIINGSGDMKDYSAYRIADYTPWRSYVKSIKIVIIENGVTSIGEEAFYGYSNLKYVIIGNSVKTIGERAFIYCFGLIYVTIGNSVKTIGNSAFYECRNLTSITIPSSVKTIEKGAFCHCMGLTSITIGNGVTTIGMEAFYDCNGLKSVKIPNSVKTIEQLAFAKCSSLTSVTFGNSVKTIGYAAFRDCSSFTSVTIRNSVTTIGYAAFENCSGLTSVTIGNGVTTIEEKAFRDCSSLTSVKIPNSVKTIGDWAFYSSGLISVTIGNSVEIIGEGAFVDCENLVYITCYASKPPFIGDYSAFDEDTATDCTLYVLAESVDLYKQAPAWQDFKIAAIGKYDNEHIDVNGEKYVYQLTGNGFVLNRKEELLDSGDFGNKQNPLYGKIYRTITDIPELKNWVTLGGSVIYENKNEDNSYRFCINYFKDDNNDMICIFVEIIRWADENRRIPNSKILDTVNIGKLKNNEIFVPCLCRLDTIRNNEIIAVALENDKEFYDKIVRAWRVDTKTGRIIPIDIQGIDCTNEGYGV